MDPSRSRVTLMFGVHDSLDLFVAVDPAMHNPTWFSSSVEFKEQELKAATRTGWHGWERDRVAAGRRHVLPQEDLRTEVLVALRPEQFLTYAFFERLATGMRPGERLLLVDRLEQRIGVGQSAEGLVRWPPARIHTEDIAKHRYYAS